MATTLEVRAWTVERPTRPDEQGRVLIDGFYLTRREALAECERRGSPWRSAEMHLPVPVRDIVT